MTVKISQNLTKTSHTIDYRTNKKIIRITHPNGATEIWEADEVYNPIKRIK